MKNELAVSMKRDASDRRLCPPKQLAGNFAASVKNADNAHGAGAFKVTVDHKVGNHYGNADMRPKLRPRGATLGMAGKPVVEAFVAASAGGGHETPPGMQSRHSPYRRGM